MDVNEVLAAIRAAIRDFERADTLNEEGEAGVRLIDAWRTLDARMVAGHMLPDDWRRPVRSIFSSEMV